MSSVFAVNLILMGFENYYRGRLHNGVVWAVSIAQLVLIFIGIPLILIMRSRELKSKENVDKKSEVHEPMNP
jgi:ACR3 family arsenite efflux pump ArsB